MKHYKAYPLPPYTELAVGYVPTGPSLRWMAVYRKETGEEVWDDGLEQANLPPELMSIFERLWGWLVRGYAYLLDVQSRQVYVVVQTRLVAFIRNEGQRSSPWRTDEHAAREVVEALIAYTESCQEADAEQACESCYFGFVWVEALQQFMPCAWCNDTMV